MAIQGRGHKRDRSGKTLDDYNKLVPAMLKTFSKRSAVDRHRIQSAYPDVDLILVCHTLRQKILPPEFAASAIEDAVNYQALVGSSLKEDYDGEWY